LIDCLRSSEGRLFNKEEAAFLLSFCEPVCQMVKSSLGVCFATIGKWIHTLSRFGLAGDVSDAAIGEFRRRLLQHRCFADVGLAHVSELHDPFRKKPKPPFHDSGDLRLELNQGERFAIRLCWF
jgi:hypothetical protein